MSARRVPRRLVSWVMLASLTGALLLPSTGSAGPADTIPAPKGMRTVFVELSRPPVADIVVMDGVAQAGAAVQEQIVAIAQEQTDFRKAAKAAGIKLTERYAYAKLFNGFSVRVSAADLPALARLPGVTNIYPVMAIERPELHSSTEMIRAPEVVVDGYDGTGVKVAIIDTGIDYTHPDLGGCTAIGGTCRTAKGWDFVGNAYTSPDDTPMPDADPMDQNGHGTHVAGIIGARAATAEGVTGVAPGATFYSYKVFGAEGGTSADVINAALEQAYTDGADVVNMSLGSSFQWPRYPTAVAADRLVTRGVVVSVSAGNSGTDGLFAGGAPSVGSKVMAVASYDNNMITVLRANISDGSTAGYGVMTFSPDPAGHTFGVVPVPNLGNSDSDYTGLNLSGKAALISRGGATFATKVARAQRLGAAAAIIHNNVDGFFAGTLGAETNGGQPWIYAASLSKADGLRLRTAATASPTTVAFTPQTTSIHNPTGGQVSSFSSWGPAPDLDLKPDVGAPGGMIYSTFPVGKGSYTSLSGTSMAAPHASGAAALLLQADPRLKGQKAQEVLRNTASPRQVGDSASYWPVNRQGAGMIDVRSAVSTPVRISPSKLSLGEFETTGARTVSLQLTNSSNRNVTYNIQHNPALSSFVSYPNNPAVQLGDLAATVTAPRSVTVPARGSVRVNISVTPPTDMNRRNQLFGGYVTFTAPNGSPTLSVPYEGYWGDYQELGTLDYNAYGLPWLASLVGGNYHRVDRIRINPTADERAYVLINLARHATRMRLTALALNGRNMGKVVDMQYVGRNSGPTDFYELAWDGRDNRGALVPRGDYMLVLEVLRPLGDESNPDHWDNWVSGIVQIRY